MRAKLEAEREAKLARDRLAAVEVPIIISVSSSFSFPSFPSLIFTCDVPNRKRIEDGKIFDEECTI